MKRNCIFWGLNFAAFFSLALIVCAGLLIAAGNIGSAVLSAIGLAGFVLSVRTNEILMRQWLRSDLRDIGEQLKRDMEAIGCEVTE
jgi:hypothetical protein